MLSQFGKIHLINWEKKEQTFEFWSEAFNFRDAGQNTVFEQLALFALHVLSLPFSNAAVERVFSQMNIVKTNLRNKMGLKSLNAILSIRLDFKMFNAVIPRHCSAHSLDQFFLRPYNFTEVRAGQTSGIFSAIHKFFHNLILRPIGQ